MGILRAFGYFIALVIMIGGTLFLPLLGLGIPFIVGIIMMWVLHKGGQVTAMKKDLTRIRMMEEEKLRQDLEKRKDALAKGWDE